MRRTILRGRQLGKSTLQDTMIKHQAQLMQRSIDRQIMQSLWKMERYNHVKSWKSRNGTKMHRIECNDEVYDWLVTEHPQAGRNNPDWWKFERMINITDQLYTLLTLRWAE